MATLLKVLNNLADIKSVGGVALRVRTQEELLGREVGGGDAFEDLLIGRVRRLGRAPVLADQRLDRRPVENIERVERAAAVITRIEDRRVDDQHLLEQHAQPVGERMAPVRPREEARDGVGALFHSRLMT
jgi:hypothetical protein